MSNEWKESEICIKTGLSRAEVRNARKEALEGRHWIKKPNNKIAKLWPIYWTQDGLYFLQQKFNLTEEDTQEIIVSQQEEKEIIGIVVRKFRNPRVIECDIMRDKGYDRHNVLVRDSRNFVVGMKVPLRSDGVRWVVKKHPRFGGKW